MGLARVVRPSRGALAAQGGSWDLVLRVVVLALEWRAVLQLLACIPLTLLRGLALLSWAPDLP